MNANATQEHRMPWMPPHAPYMPVASVGLLRVLADSGSDATLHWESAEGWQRPCLVLRSDLGVEDVAAAIASAPWPELDSLPWTAKPGQAIKPTLARDASPDDDLAAVKDWRALAGFDGPGSTGEPDPSAGPGLGAAHQLIAALLTDGAVDGSNLPGRNRLLRGVKADLSGVAKPPKVRQAELLRELEEGPIWRSGSSGLGLGFVPQVQTFGGTTGPEPSAVGAYSGLLYRLCWHGIISMPPFGVRRGRWSVVGGPLFSAGDVLSWATWGMPLDHKALIALFGLEAIHQPEPDPRLLRAHEITAVFRSTSRKINTMISVFGWADRIA